MDEDKFKLALATDLIIFIAQVITADHKVDSGLLINEVMNKWSERVEASASVMKEQMAEHLMEQGAIADKDVAMIMLDVNNTANKIVKGEFKTQMREAILKGLAAYSKQ